MDINILASILYFILGVLVIVKLSLSKTYYDFFWFCDFTPFLFAISFFTSNLQFTKGLINIGLLSQIITLILLLYGFVLGKNIIGSREAVSRGKFYVFVEILIHISAIVAFILTYKTVSTGASLYYSFIILLFMFFVTLIFTDSKRNINLLYNLGISNKRFQDLKLPFHTVLWLVYSFILALITFLIQNSLYIYIKQ